MNMCFISLFNPKKVRKSLYFRIIRIQLKLHIKDVLTKYMFVSIKYMKL